MPRDRLLSRATDESATFTSQAVEFELFRGTAVRLINCWVLGLKPP